MIRRTRKSLIAAALASTLLLAATPALGDEYKREESGHPLRIAAYVLHPIGVVIETLIVRPAHWLGSLAPFEWLFGHEDPD
jgi:hypothetical protein